MIIGSSVRRPRARWLSLLTPCLMAFACSEAEPEANGLDVPVEPSSSAPVATSNPQQPPGVPTAPSSAGPSNPSVTAPSPGTAPSPTGTVAPSGTGVPTAPSVPETPSPAPTAGEDCEGPDCGAADPEPDPQTPAPQQPGPEPEQPDPTQPGPGQPEPETPNEGQPSEQPSEQPAPETPSDLAAQYPCNGDASAYDAVVQRDGGAWNARNGSNSVYQGNDLLAAVTAAFGSLSNGRTSQQKVLLQGDGSLDAQTRISIPSYTLFNVCGTIDVSGSPSGDNAAAYSRGTTDITIPNFSASGVPAYAMFFRNVNNLHLGKVELRLRSGLGIRVDNHGGDRAVRSTNLRIDDVYVEGASNHGVETYGVDGIQIGRVVARRVGYSGLLLNDSANAEVGVVDGEDVATGQGYAVFRMANRNGRLNNQYPANIRVGRVIARGGGRGVFCVSESGGAVIDYVDLEGTGNNSILLENCYNVTVGNAAERSRIANSGELRIAARDDMPNTADIVIRNIALSGTPARESPCATNSQWIDIETSGAFNVCN